jgi:hypothetical protein
MVKSAINGLGRIRRAFLALALEEPALACIIEVRRERIGVQKAMLNTVERRAHGTS